MAGTTLKVFDKPESMTLTQADNLKLIAVDLDGTLLNSHHELTARTEQALKRAMAMGLEVVLATGKTRASAAGVIAQLGLTSPGVYLQGLAIYNGDGTIRHQQTLNNLLARKAAEFIEAKGYTVMAYSGVRILIREHNRDADRVIAYQEPKVEVVGSDLDHYIDNYTINKLHFFIDDPDQVGPIRGELQTLMDGQATVVMPNNVIMEVLPFGASKGNGLKLLLDDLRIDPKQVIAFGDGENDVEMITLAGIGVAMGNSMPKAKAAADYVTGTNDDDGVAEMLERLVLRS